MSKTAAPRPATLRGMASIRKEIRIDVEPAAAWDALRDWGAVHERLVPGFVTACRLDGDDRIVTFFNGATVRELLVDLDDDARRLAWSVVEGSYSHHNGVARVFGDGAGGTRFVWRSDILPHDLAPATAELMEHGIGVVKATLEAAQVGGGEPSERNAAARV